MDGQLFFLLQTLPLNHEKGERRKHEENADGEKKLQVVSIDESK
jgi:hypothetical protein